jgi:phosphoheptose isomerase
MSEFLQFVDDYYSRFIRALEAFDRSALEGVLGVFEGVAESGGTLWIAGNGGSASIADHTVCDTSKGTYVEGQPPLRSISLSANNAMITALGNDIGYEEIFRQQLLYYLQPGDALLVVSSSGNSPNVVAACRYAKERGAPTIAFVGFKGGELAELADHVVWIPAENYGIAEDTHQSLMHCVTQFLLIQSKARAAG